MLIHRWRPLTGLLCAGTLCAGTLCAGALAALPGAAAASVRAGSPGGPAGSGGTTLVTSDAIRDNQQWVLDMMNVAAAWDEGDEGAGTTVAVIDSGVNPDVSDLTGSVLTGPDFTGVDTPSSNPDWGVHGTWMASLIAGHGHDGGDSGVIGVAPQSRILSVRVIPDKGDPNYNQYEHEQETQIQSSLAKGIDYAVRRGAEVISMSIGYSAPSGAVREALEEAYEHGVVVVASAGNSGDQSGSGNDSGAPVSFPADYPGVISVGAVDDTGAVASFSSDNLSVQLAAPGVSVPAQGRDGQYWLVSGTSPACALVAGVAALIKSRYPHLAPDLVATALTSTTADQPAGGYDSQLGFGIVDAGAALAKAAELDRDPPDAAGASAAVRFGGGLRNVPPAPVRPRGSGDLMLFGLLALTSLVLTAAAVTRLRLLHRPRHAH